MTHEQPARKTSPPARRALGGDSYGWDWSQTTHEGAGAAGRAWVLPGAAQARPGGVGEVRAPGLVDELLEALGAVTVTLGKGLQGWSHSLHGFDVGGYKLGEVYFGGGRDDVHVRSTSAQADGSRAAVVSLGDARTARVDTRVDTLLPFEDLRSLCEGLGGCGTQVRYFESRTLSGGGRSEAAGRTVYVGSPKSWIQVRVYEKWLEAGKDRNGEYLYQPGTNRVEVQLRPPSRAKREVSSWGRAETFCASKLTRRLAKELELDVAEPGTLQKSKGTPDLERSIAAMGEQYGGVFARWMVHSGGDVGKVLDHLTGESRQL